jgi:hypothetical protein
MASKGLPGFLRRSRRSSFNDSEDEEEDLDASESNDPSQNNNNNNKQETTTSATAEEQLQRSTTSETSLFHNNNDSWKLEEEYEEQQRNPHTQLDRQSSISTLGSGRGGDENVIPTIERRLSYRESQFEKTITNDVVKMSELRKLGWNGIPVSDYIIEYCIVQFGTTYGIQ